MVLYCVGRYNNYCFEHLKVVLYIQCTELVVYQWVYGPVMIQRALLPFTIIEVVMII